MKRIILLTTAVLSLASARNELTFAVLGDRTPDAQSGLFEQMIGEVRLLRPDVVISTGNLIEGTSRNRDTLRAEWDTLQKLLRSTGAGYRLTPGDLDLASPLCESVYFQKFGSPCYSFNLGNCHFVVLDNSRWDSIGSLPAAELAWLERDLAAGMSIRWRFVFMHRSSWMASRRAGQTGRLHELFKRFGVQYVFSGHDRFYSRMTWDGIVYTQVGPSGSRLREGDRPERGAFQGYLYVTVDDVGVNVSVIKPGGLFPADCVTWEDQLTLDSIDRAGLRIPAVVLSDAKALVESLEVTITDVGPDFLSGTCVWRQTGSNWKVEPETVTIAAGPGRSCVAQYRVRLAAGASPYPLPVLQLLYPYGKGRQYDLRRPLPVNRVAACPAAPAPRLDGILNDVAWKKAKAIGGFGSREGESNPTEPLVVHFAHDDSTLYIAARCTETRMSSLTAGADEPEGLVPDDDNVDFLLRPNPDSAVLYELTVNPAGAVRGGRFRTERTRSARGEDWSGKWRIALGRGSNFWTVEIAIPLSEFPGYNSKWGFNVARYQARLDRLAAFQTPFGRDPARLATLELTK